MWSLLSFLAGILITLWVAKNVTTKSELKIYYEHDRLLNVLEMLPNDISVSVNGSLIKELSITRVRLWNSGKKVIKGDDIALKAPIFISFPDGTKLLSCSIVKTTSDLSNFCLETSESKVNIVFDFCKPNNGINIVIVSDTFDKPTFQGELVVDSSRPIKNNGTVRNWVQRYHWAVHNGYTATMSNVLAIVMCSLVMLIGAIVVFALIQTFLFNPNVQVAIITFIAVASLIILTIWVYKGCKRFYRLEEGPSSLL